MPYRDHAKDAKKASFSRGPLQGFEGALPPYPLPLVATPAAPCSRMLLVQHTRTAGRSEERLFQLLLFAEAPVRVAPGAIVH